MVKESGSNERVIGCDTVLPCGDKVVDESLGIDDARSVSSFFFLSFFYVNIYPVISSCNDGIYRLNELNGMTNESVESDPVHFEENS